jgi:hypothetical protein
MAKSPTKFGAQLPTISGGAVVPVLAAEGLDIGTLTRVADK